MKIIRDEYYGEITYPEVMDNEESLDVWKEVNCPNGIHLFDEVFSPSEHYLICDACEIIVHIEFIEIP